MNEMPYRRPEGDPRAEEVADLVRRIAANRRALLPYRPRFPELTATVKDPWTTARPAPALAAFIADLDLADTVSLRLDARLEREFGDPPLGRPVRAGERTIEFRRGRQVTGRISGEPSLIELLVAVLPDRVDDPGTILVPKDEALLARRIATDSAEVARLLDEGRDLVERVERLVCALYAVPDDLTEAVVAHAVSRSRGPAGER